MLAGSSQNGSYMLLLPSKTTVVNGFEIVMATRHQYHAYLRMFGRTSFMCGSWGGEEGREVRIQKRRGQKPALWPANLATRGRRTLKPLALGHSQKNIHISSIKIVLAPEQERAPLLKVPLKLECLLGTFYRPGENF